MKNPAWGTKRTCQGCAAKYYDLGHTPIVCPKCGVVYDPASGIRLRSDASYKAQGGRAKSVFGGKATPLGFAEAEVATTTESLGGRRGEPETDDDEDAVEDVAELGDDADDLAEIVEKDEHEGN